jgi:hypothetical protein
MRLLLFTTILFSTTPFLPGHLVATPRDIVFTMPANSIEVYDIFELSVTVLSPDPQIPSLAPLSTVTFLLRPAMKPFTFPTSVILPMVKAKLGSYPSRPANA